MKIVGNTVGTSLPKPDLRQKDPRKGDFVKGKDEIAELVNNALAQAKASGEFKGEPGQPGEDGDPGKDGQDGKDYVLTDADKADIAEQAAELVNVPTKVSQLTNDSGFQTAQDVADVIAQIEIPEAVTDEHINSLIDAKLGDIPESSGGEVWDVLLDVITEEDVAQVSATELPDGRTIDEYKKLMFIIFVRPNSGGYTSMIKVTFNPGNHWSSPGIGLEGNLGNKNVEHAGMLSVFVLTKFPDGWFITEERASYNSTSMNNSLVVYAKQTQAQHVGTFNSNTVPTKLENILSYESNGICIGGYQDVLGAGSMIRVLGCRPV